MYKNIIETVGSWTGDLQFCQNWIDAVTTHSNSQTQHLGRRRRRRRRNWHFFFNFEFTGVAVFNYLLNINGKYLMTFSLPLSRWKLTSVPGTSNFYNRPQTISIQLKTPHSLTVTFSKLNCVI